MSIQVLPDRRIDILNQRTERTMTKTLFISLPVTDLSASPA